LPFPAQVGIFPTKQISTALISLLPNVFGDSPQAEIRVEEFGSTSLRAEAEISHTESYGLTAAF
jgi:hypothetical protein